MPAPVVIPPGGGEVIGDAPDRRVDLLCDDDPLHATWSRFGAGREGADLHVHREHTDHFYVLDGEFTLRLGAEDEQVTAGPGTLVRVPPMVVHGFRNASDTDVTYLNLHAPGAGFAAFMRGIRDGSPVGYDQHDPPADGVASTALVSLSRGLGVLSDAPELTVHELPLDPGGEVVGDVVYVLEGALDGAPAGSWVRLPPAAVTPPAVEPARVLVLSFNPPSPGTRR